MNKYCETSEEIDSPGVRLVIFEKRRVQKNHWIVNCKAKYLLLHSIVQCNIHLDGYLIELILIELIEVLLELLKCQSVPRVRKISLFTFDLKIRA